MAREGRPSKESWEDKVYNYLKEKGGWHTAFEISEHFRQEYEARESQTRKEWRKKIAAYDFFCALFFESFVGSISPALFELEREQSVRSRPTTRPSSGTKKRIEWAAWGNGRRRKANVSERESTTDVGRGRWKPA